MRELTSNERRLLLFVVVVGFLFLNFWGYTQAMAWRTRAIAKGKVLSLQIKELRSLQDAKAVSAETREWIDSKLPVYKNDDEFLTDLLNRVKASASSASLDDIKVQPRDPERDPVKMPYFHRTAVDVEFTSDIETILKFLASVENQDEFRAVTSLEFVPRKDPKEVQCNARFEQWWSPDSQVLAGQVAEAPLVEPAPASSVPPAAPAAAPTSPPAAPIPTSAPAPVPPANQ